MAGKFINLASTDIEFKVDGIPYSFTIFHNLPEKPGLSLQDALNNWIHRTEDYTAQSFVNYIDSKKQGFYALTEGEFAKVLQAMEEDESNGGKGEGDICNRAGCKGEMGYTRVDDCSCHINPPCSACVDAPLVCSDCGYIFEE